VIQPPPPRGASLESILCTNCGLCCNGSFFADIELSGPREAARLEFAGLEIEDDALLLQPCRALDGKRCSMYAHRPKCCRTFECRLLQRTRRGEISTAAAQQQIDIALQQTQQIKKLLARFPPSEDHLSLKERCIEAISSTENSAVAAKLETAIASFDSFINKTFLNP
jgi:Fe-S-cluster containining protein